MNLSPLNRAGRPARAALPFVVLLFAAGCKPAAGPPQGFPPPSVSVVVLEAKDVPVTYEYAAQTAGYREVEVRARITGILLKRNYREGAGVKRGESLFTIDTAPFQVALARAEADAFQPDSAQIRARRRRSPALRAARWFPRARWCRDQACCSRPSRRRIPCTCCLEFPTANISQSGATSKPGDSSFPKAVASRLP